ncbi:transposase [Fibrobacteres bacterium R8-0-B4]
MIGAQPDVGQEKLFSTLPEMLNPKHPLYVLADKIPWSEFEEAFEKNYSNMGRRAKPIRLMVSLLILKQMYNLGDETVVEAWVQNPYYQYFSGETVFQWHFPCNPSDLVHFRNRIKEDGVTRIFQVSINIHGKKADEKVLIADTTVQEKNIAFPTDLKLHRKIIGKCLKIACRENIVLRQSYTHTLKRLLIERRFKKNHSGAKKAAAAQRKIRTIAGRLCREITRKLPNDRLIQYKKELDMFNAVLNQRKTDSNKIYSLHEPDVYCISKGKEHKKYEFGSKVSILLTHKSGIIVGARSFAKNEYDGHTLPAALEQYRGLMNKDPHEVIGDRGYKGPKTIGETIISIPGKAMKIFTAYEKLKVRNKFRRRSSIEPVIGHMKTDTRLGRNYLKGLNGDQINVMLSAAAFNFRKWMRENIGHFVQYIKIAIRIHFRCHMRNLTPLNLTF